MAQNSHKMPCTRPSDLRFLNFFRFRLWILFVRMGWSPIKIFLFCSIHVSSEQIHVNMYLQDEDVSVMKSSLIQSNYLWSERIKLNLYFIYVLCVLAGIDPMNALLACNKINGFISAWSNAKTICSGKTLRPLYLCVSSTQYKQNSCERALAR